MMKRSISVSTILLAITCAPLLAQNAATSVPQPTAPPATSWKQVAIPQLPPFKPQPPKRIVLANGMVVFLTENHELPFIAGNAMIRGGAEDEPASKTGLVEIYGESWRTGGTEKLSGDQLDDLLEARAAKVETGAAEADTTINFNCLKGDFDDVFAVFVDLLRAGDLFGLSARRSSCSPNGNWRAASAAATMRPKRSPARSRTFSATAARAYSPASRSTRR
jgi:zinc protease